MSAHSHCILILRLLYGFDEVRIQVYLQCIAANVLKVRFHLMCAAYLAVLREVFVFSKT